MTSEGISSSIPSTNCTRRATVTTTATWAGRLATTHDAQRPYGEDQIQGIESRIQALQTQVASRKQLDGVITKKQAAESLLTASNTKLEEAEQLLSRARITLGDLERARLAAQASILAAELEDEKPCPVCGSLDHPKPAEAAHELPTDQDIDDATEAAKTAESARDNAKTDVSGAQTELAVQTEAESNLRSTLGDAAGQSVSDLAAALSVVEREKTDEETRAKAAVKLKEALEAFVGKIKDAEKKLGDASSELRTAEGERNAANGRFQQAEAAVPEVYREQGALETAIETHTSQIDALHTELVEAASAYQEAVTAHATATSESKSAKAALDEARKKHEKQSADWNRRLADASFESEEAFVQARMDEPARKALENEVAKFDSARKETSTLLREAQDQTKEPPAPRPRHSRQGTESCKVRTRRVGSHPAPRSSRS